MGSRHDWEAELEAVKELCKREGVDTEGTSGSNFDQLVELETRHQYFSACKAVEAHEKKCSWKEGPQYHEKGSEIQLVWTATSIDVAKALRQPGCVSLPMTLDCSTPARICYWAGSVSFHKEFVDIRKEVLYSDHGEKMVRKFASINAAYRNGYFEVSQYASYDFPPGATGEKIPQPKLASGGKGLRRPGDPDVPDNEDVYVPKGVSRKLENRPPRGRWYFPRPSRLSQEYIP